MGTIAAGTGNSIFRLAAYEEIDHFGKGSQISDFVGHHRKAALLEAHSSGRLNPASSGWNVFAGINVSHQLLVLTLRKGLANS